MTLCHDPLKVVRAHQLEELAPPALDRERLRNNWRSLWNNALQALATLGERPSAQVSAVQPEEIESHVTGAPRHAEQLVELRSVTLVDRDYLAVDYRLVDIEQPTNLVGERVETTKHVAVARNEAAAARLKVAEAAETIIFELKEPFGVVERLLSPRRDDRLYAGKCHPADMARPADLSNMHRLRLSHRTCP